MKKLSYNEREDNAWLPESSSFFHEEAYPFHQYYPPGTIVDNPNYIDGNSEGAGDTPDSMGNKDRATGGDFPEFNKKQYNRIKQLKRLKKLKEMLQSKRQNPALQPSPFYSSMYGSMVGTEGLNSSPLAYYSGNIADGPDNLVNPWQNTYQSSATAASAYSGISTQFLSTEDKMALYKSAQAIFDLNDDHDHLDGENEIVLYDEKPSKKDVIEMHAPEEGMFEISFKLPPLPGSDADMPLEVSTDEIDKPKKKDKNDVEAPKEMEVKDPWDWQSGGAGQVLNWVKERFSNIPRHSGRETAGIERAIAYLKRLNAEMSKAASNDYDGHIDISQFEAARSEIYAAIERLEDAKEKLEATHYKRKKGESLHELIKEGKQTQIGGIIITVPLLISRIARVCINSMVSAGKDIEKVVEAQVKEYSLDKREQAELLQLLEDMGYAMPRRDRGFGRDHQMDYTSTDNFDFGANYSA